MKVTIHRCGPLLRKQKLNLNFYYLRIKNCLVSMKQNLREPRQQFPRVGFEKLDKNTDELRVRGLESGLEGRAHSS